LRGLLSEQSWQLAGPPMEQLSLFEDIVTNSQLNAINCLPQPQLYTTTPLFPKPFAVAPEGGMACNGGPVKCLT
jgi:hypothetical protein